MTQAIGALPFFATAAMESIWSGRQACSVESVLLDVKQDARTLKESLRVALDASLCLANTQGGVILFGLDDDAGGPDAFLGTDLDSADVCKYIHDNSRPHLLVEAHELAFHDRRLLAITVNADTEIYCDARGRAPYRLGTDCVAMDPATAQRVREDRQGFDPSARRSQLPDIDPEAVARARQRLRTSLRPDRQALAQLSQADLLRALGVVDKAGHLLAAGHQLLGVDDFQVLYTYRETPGGEPRVIERIGGPILLAYDRVMEYILLRRQLTPVTLPNGQQLQVEDFPELAVREALSNAFIHRDYRLEGPIVVEHSPSVLVITSPGQLVAGVTMANILTHPSKPRNRTLTAAVRVLELAEEVGRGVDRMYREMIRSGRPAPLIEESQDQVRVVLVGGAPDTNIARYVAQDSSGIQNDTDAMIILLRLCSKRTVTAESLAPLLQKSKEEAQAALRHLASDSVAMIEPTRQSARSSFPHYRLREEPLRQLGSAVAYIRYSHADVDSRVVAHLREYERITNSTIQNIFRVEMPRARQILADLVGRGILVKTSQAQRGPSVTYGPGPRFPQ